MEKYLPQLKKYVSPIKRHIVLICIVLIGAAYGYLIMTASSQTEVAPSETEIANKFQGTSRPKLDDSAAKRLEQLQEQNIEVQAIFDKARNNPFSE